MNWSRDIQLNFARAAAVVRVGFRLARKSVDTVMIGFRKVESPA